MSDQEIPVDELQELIDDKEDAEQFYRLALLNAAARPLLKLLNEHPDAVAEDTEDTNE